MRRPLNKRANGLCARKSADQHGISSLSAFGWGPFQIRGPLLAFGGYGRLFFSLVGLLLQQVRGLTDGTAKERLQTGLRGEALCLAQPLQITFYSRFIKGTLLFTDTHTHKP